MSAIVRDPRPIFEEREKERDWGGDASVTGIEESVVENHEEK